MRTDARRDVVPGSARWRALGTSVAVLTADPGGLVAARTAVEEILAEIDLALSRFRDDSELSRLNAQAGTWHDASPLALRALRVAVDAARWSGGLVDPTVGASMLRLGYDRTFRLLPEDGPAVTVAVAADHTSIELDDVSRRVRWPSGVLVDVGATAKGLAADLAAVAAHAAAGCGVLVNLGGDLRAEGPAPAVGWDVWVTDKADPDLASPDDAGQVVAVHSGGLATSGTRARRWRRGGAELHHILDPRTGFPTAGPWRTVSVTAATCVLANSASTAAVVLGEAAPAWLTERRFAARLVHHDGQVTTTPGWPV